MEGVGNGERAAKELRMEVEMSSHLEADTERERDNDRADMKRKGWIWNKRCGNGSK